MKIMVIESSPHKNGSSNHLAEQFAQGALDAGHEILIFDAARANLHPCLGCGACGMSGPCCQIDDMTEIRLKILQSDMIVFVTPLYYFGMSAQLKLVIDRFYSFNGALTSKQLKTALIVASWENNDWTMHDIKAHYTTLCRYLHFRDQGMILATACGTVSLAQDSKYSKLAYELGQSLG